MDEQTNEETIGRQDVHPDNMTSGRWFGRADADEREGWEKARTYNCMNVCRTEGTVERTVQRTNELNYSWTIGRKDVRALGRRYGWANAKRRYRMV